MNILLIFFALPIATIIISIALQRILKCPPLVAAIIFAIFLVVTFIVDDLNFLIAAIVYAIISFITAFIICIICRFFSNEDEDNTCNSCFTCSCSGNQTSDSVSSQNQLLTINSSYQNNGNNELLTSNSYNEAENDLLSVNNNKLYDNYNNGRANYSCRSYRRR